MNVISLAGQWQASWTDGNHGFDTQYREPASDAARYLPFAFPGSVQANLQAAGLLDDPRMGMNALKARWVEEQKWILRRSFSVPAEAVAAQAAGRPALLHLEVVDGPALIALNGQVIGAHANSFRPLYLPLTGLREGENELVILLESGLFRVADLPFGEYANRTDMQLNKRMHLRQPQYQFGWDWNPRLVFFGLHGKMEVLWDAPVCLQQVSVLAEVAEGLQSAQIRVKPMLWVAGDASISAEITVSSQGGMRAEVITTLCPGENEPELVLQVDHPRLWQPRGYGEAYLYPIEAQVRVDGQPVASWQGRTGLRRVTLEQPPHPVEGQYFHLQVNGQTIFCKGANWVPPEMSAFETDPAKIRRMVALAEAENMNLLRIWGGGVWAGHPLLDLCDEKGILIWHDLLFACAKYPGDQPEFLREVEREVSWGIREFSPHPSLVVWAGNNENEAGLWEWGYKDFGRTAPDMVLYHHLFPVLMERLDGTRPYVPSSPYSSVTRTPSDPTLGDQHPWGVSLAWDDLNFWAYRRYEDRFPNEGGVLGCAPESALRRFLDEKELAPRSFAWETHDNEVSFWHSAVGVTYRAVDYWLGKPAAGMSAGEYALASGLLQAEGLKEYIQNYRRRMPSTSSAIYWMFNDSWPTVHGWGTLDYYLNRKLSFFPVKRAFADVIVVLADEGERMGVYVVNDTAQAVRMHLRAGSFVPSGDRQEAVSQTVKVAARSSLRVAELARDEARIAYAVLQDGRGRMMAQDRMLLKPWSAWRMQPAQIKIEVVRIGGQRFARYSSDAWVWGVILDPSGEQDVQDDVFDLLPGIPYEVALGKKEKPRAVAMTGNGMR